MNETIRTLAYVAVAAVIGLVSWGTASLTGPRIEKIDPNDETGQPLVPAFTDPLAATALEIVEYDEKTLETRQFKVERDAKGVWKIPSHFDYPADAARQLEEAAASVIDLKKLGVVTDDKADHALFGVVEPSMSSAAEAAEGVGKSIKLTGGSGVLAHFIVGKADPQKADLHFVRLPNQDRVYRVAVNVSKLSTRFQDWIEKDLLKLNAFDVRQVLIDSYSVDEANQRIAPGEQVLARYDAAAAKWSVDDLPAGEQINEQKLNDLKSALDTLQIVDVQRKPAGISADLRVADDIRRPTEEEFRSLAARGYYVVPVRMSMPDGSEGVGEALLSDEGEVSILCADGVVYRLRFGNIAANTGGGSGGEEEAAAADGAEAQTEEASNPEANRYVFVTVEFDKSLIPAPELPGEEGAAEEAAGGEAPAEGDAGASVEDAESPDGPAPDDAGGDTSEVGDCQVPEADEADTDEAADDAEPAEGEAVTELPAEDDEAAAGAGAAEAEPPAGDAAADAEAERQVAEVERQRKIDEYNDKVKKGEERVKELSARFADWYYVISDSVYKKIHLTRADVIQQAPLDPEGGTGALEGLDLPEGDDPSGASPEPDEDAPADEDGSETGASTDDATEPETAPDAEEEPETDAEPEPAEPEAEADDSGDADDAGADDSAADENP